MGTVEHPGSQAWDGSLTTAYRVSKYNFERRVGLEGKGSTSIEPGVPANRPN
jgi:hypothetical protein